MRILRLVGVFGVFGFGFGFGLGLGCSGGARPAPTGVVDARAPAAPSTSAAGAAAGGRLCKTSGPALLLPAIAPSHDLKLDVDKPGGVAPADWKGKLTVDGVVTASMWPMNAPTQWKLPDGRTLLYDGYNANLAMLWDPKTKTLTELGRGVLMPVAGQGMLIYTSEGNSGEVGIFSDVDPAAPRLRELWRFERAKANTQVAGLIDGVPVLMQQPPPARVPALMVPPPTGSEPDGAEQPLTLLCLSGAGVTSRFDAVVPEGFAPMGVDPVDGHRMLLLGESGVDFMGSPGGNKPFDAEVAVLDLATGKHRSIGRAQGGWTQTTAVPHPVLRVGWQTGPVATGQYYLAEGAVTYVDPKTERLVSGAR